MENGHPRSRQQIPATVQYTQKTLQRFTNVKAFCVRDTTWILVKIRFNTPNAAQDIDEQFILNNLARKYKIEAPARFARQRTLALERVTTLFGTFPLRHIFGRRSKTQGSSQ